MSAVVLKTFNTIRGELNSTAEYHKRRASKVLWITGGIITTCVAVAVALSLAHHESGSWEAYVGPLSTRILLVVSGGWAIKWGFSMYKMHEEQSVIYKDRSIGLHVVELILAHGDDPAENRAALTKMNDGFFNFDQSAFRREVPTPEGTIDLKGLKDVTEAVAPLVGAAKRVAKD